MQNAYLVIGIVLAIIIVGTVILPKIKKSIQKNKRKITNEFLKNREEEQRPEKELKLKKLIQRTNESLDRYEKQSQGGQDKYQVGRAIGRLCFEFQEEYYNLFRQGATENGQNEEVDALTARIDNIANSDILIENGMENFRDEQRNNNEVKKQTDAAINTARIIKESLNSKEDTITKTFVNSEKYLSIEVNSYIKEHKNYGLVFQTPVMKTLFGMYQTTVTLKKIK